MRGFNRDGFPKMPGDWLFKVFPIFIAIVFIAIVCYYIFLGFVAKKVVSALGDCGIPAVVVSNDGNGNQSYTVKCEDKK